MIKYDIFKYNIYTSSCKSVICGNFPVYITLQSRGSFKTNMTIVDVRPVKMLRYYFISPGQK